MANMNHDVFISYSHKNKPMADAVCATLEQNGIRCWYAPRDIAPGREWAECIIEAIEGCRVFLLLFSDYSNASTQVLREVSKAVSSQKVIIPIKVTDTVPSGSMEYYLSTVHWLDMLDQPLQEQLRTLLMRVDSVLQINRDADSYVIPNIKRFWRKSRLPYIISAAALLVILVMVFILAKSGLLARPSASVSKDKASSSKTAFTVLPTEDKLGTSISNANNNGLAAEDGTYIYYQSNDGMSLYRMRMDGSEKQQLCNMPVRDINVYDGKLYFSLITSGLGKVYRMDATGGEPELLMSKYVENLLCRNGQLYYNDGEDKLKLYAMSLDTGWSTRLCARNTHGVFMDDDYIYYMDHDGAEYICRSGYDGSNPEPISKFPANDPSMCGQTLVYMQRLPSGNRELIVQDVRTLEALTLSIDITLNSINVTPDAIYGWYGKNDRKFICKITLDGTMTDLLELEEGVSDINVAGDWIFFINKADDYRVWAMRTDGSNAGPV